MRSLILAFALVVACASSAAAEPTPLRWPGGERAAGWISDGALAAQVFLEARDAWRAEHRGKAFACMAAENAVALGATELLKRLTHRERPDGSDALSFPSGHTATASVNAHGWRWGLVVQVGYLRQAAWKHHLSDVLAGWGIGLAAGQICGE